MWPDFETASLSRGKPPSVRQCQLPLETERRITSIYQLSITINRESGALTFLFIPSCWMSARMTCWERRHGGVNICDGFAISHVLTTRGRLLAFSAVWNAASKSPRDRCDRTERWLSSKVFLAALAAAAPPGDPSTCGVAARLLGGNLISLMTKMQGKK